jgi:hypothetical protein
MKARQSISGASLGPEALKVVGQAFDQAWASIAGNFGGSASALEARLKLASLLLAMADDNSRDVVALRSAALEAMRRGYAGPVPTDPE